MFGLWGDSRIHDFVHYFLRPASADGSLQDKRELTEIFSLGYGLRAASASERDLVLPVLTDAIRKSPVVGSFSQKELLAAKRRFLRRAGSILSEAQLDQAEQWFNGLEQKYCITPDEKARATIEEWIRVVENRDGATEPVPVGDRVTAAVRCPEQSALAPVFGTATAAADALAAALASASNTPAEHPAAATDTIAASQPIKASPVSSSPVISPTPASLTETASPVSSPPRSATTPAPIDLAASADSPFPDLIPEPSASELSSASASTLTPCGTALPVLDPSGVATTPTPIGFAALADSRFPDLIPEPCAPALNPAPVAPPTPVVSDAEGMDDAVWNIIETRCRAAMTAWEDQATVATTLEEFQALLSREGLPGLLYDQFRNDDPARQAFVVDDTDEACETYFLGDIHSDLLALEAAIIYLERRPVNTKMVFLGDLFDDGPLGCEILLRVFRLILENPGRICLLAGNHDEALGYDGTTESFTAAVEPCEFSEWLNAENQRRHPLARRIGQLTIELFHQVPRAIFFRDGLLAAHGGVPLRDLWDSWQSSDSLNDPKCLQDFVWTRPHPRYPKRIPNRSSKGAGLGYQDFEGFCERAGKLLGFDVQRMVRGHDHIQELERFALFPAYARRPMLTVNTMCYRLDREPPGPHERIPCLAKRVPGQLPEIVCMRIPPELVRKIHSPGTP